MSQHRQLLLANKAWSAELTDLNPNFFTRQLAGEKPEFLWIGCSDSRVTPEQMTMTQPGGMYIHRNIGNLVQADDKSLMALLDYAVKLPSLTSIIVCGHHACGGLKAAMDDSADGPLADWLAPARDVCADHASEIRAQNGEQARLDRLVECNVRDQLVNLARLPMIGAAFASGKPLVLHGWVYDMRTGLLKPLMEIDGTTELDKVPTPESVLV